MTFVRVAHLGLNAALPSRLPGFCRGPGRRFPGWDIVPATCPQRPELLDSLDTDPLPNLPQLGSRRFGSPNRGTNLHLLTTITSGGGPPNVGFMEARGLYPGGTPSNRTKGPGLIDFDLYTPSARRIPPTGAFRSSGWVDW